MKYTPIQVAKGFCKDLNTPWSTEEAYAVRNLGIPADLVRKGVLTLEEYHADDVSQNVDNAPENTEGDEEINLSEMDIEALREVYKELLGKDVPNNMKNKKDRILEKIQEELEQE